MKAVLTSGAGDPQVLYLGEAPTPAPPPQHVLIRYCRDGTNEMQCLVLGTYSKFCHIINKCGYLVLQFFLYLLSV
jgi:hypothetical protein